MSLSSRQFWADALERAIRTVAQAALSLLTVSGAHLLTLTTAGFVDAVGLAGVISLLMSIVASGVGSKDSASLIK